MKKLLILLFIYPLCIAGQTPGTNNVKKIIYKDAYRTIPTDANQNVEIDYFDGLGRPKQNVKVEVGGNGEDIITHIDYDIFGRPVREYLPFAAPANSSVIGSYHTDPVAEIVNFYNDPKYATTFPYSEKHYENSPLNRVEEQAAPGELWKSGGAYTDPLYLYMDLPRIFSNCTIVTDDDSYKLFPPNPWVTLKLVDNKLIFSIVTPYGNMKQWDYAQNELRNGCQLKMQPIPLNDLPFDLPDIDLGELTNSEGLPSGYKVLILNNKIQFRLVKVNDPPPLAKFLNSVLSADISNYLDLPEVHTLKFRSQANQSVDAYKFGVSYPSGQTNEPELVVDGMYVSGQLYKNITYNENWKKADGKNNSVEEFTDKLGNVVLKRAYNNNLPHDTYYVYDLFSNLSYVIPPMAVDAVVSKQYIFNHATTNYPITNILDISQNFVGKYNNKINTYPNSDILNVNLMSEFGMSGGFSIQADVNNDITFSLATLTSQPTPYKTGYITDLTNFGSYTDRELGRIAGDGYGYVFSVRDNSIYVTGSGDVPSLSKSFSSNKKIEFSKNYPWTKICDVDANTAQAYEAGLADIENSEILTADISNTFGAHGGVSISVDEFDTVNFSLNIQNTEPLKLLKGMVIPLDIDRSLENRVLGTLSGTGYSYEISLVDNTIYFVGTGVFENVNFFANMRQVNTYNVNIQAVNSMCYIYKYDNYNRVIEKHIPDNGWTSILYDKLDRVVLTQDANQKLENSFMYTKYDIFDRVIMTGKYFDATEINNLRDIVMNGGYGLTETRSEEPLMGLPGGINVYYSDYNAFPVGGEVYTLNYYDTYFTNSPFDMSGPDYGALPQHVYNKPLGSAKGLPTVTYKRIFYDDYPGWDINVVAYDDKGRNIYSKSINYYASVETQTEHELDFTGKVTETKTIHTRYGEPVVIYDFYTYDTADRLLKHTQQINEQDKHLIVWNNYDDLGRLQQKKVGGNARFPEVYRYFNSYQTIDYTYNIRGWLQGINDPTIHLGDRLFGFKIGYDGLYNGNISSTLWQTANDNVNRAYSYTYDALNRLLSATSHENVTAPPLYVSATSNFYEGNIQYDKNGNIMKLVRNGFNGNGFEQLDNLSYIYKPQSNQLMRVTDNSGNVIGFKDGNTSGDDYAYDANGNMVTDLNKGIGSQYYYQIKYNHLNLPTGMANNQGQSLSFTYDASGKKFEKKASGSITQYSNGFVYIDNVFQYFPHPEGYVMKENDGTYNYVFQYKDHLGNVRLSYKDNNGDGSISPSEIIEETNYYPFGMQHKGYNEAVLLSNLGQNIKYLGQERQEELGLDWDSFRHRNYDYKIGRFFGVDPIAEQFMSISTYQFAHNNPVWKIELEGLEGKETQGIDLQHHEPIKVTSPNLGFVGGGLTQMKVYQETTKEVVKEVVKKEIKNSGGKLLGQILKGAGTVFALLSDTMSPNFGGSTDEGQWRYKVDEKLSLKDFKIKEKTIEETGIKRINTVEDLVKSSDEGDKTKGKSTLYERKGGIDAANKEFDNLNPENVREIDGGRVGTLEDGRTAIVREKSSDGRPTLEIQNGKKKTKFRYDE